MVDTARNTFLRNATNYPGDFGGGSWVDWMRQQGYTDPEIIQLSNASQTYADMMGSGSFAEPLVEPAYMGPSLTDITGGVSSTLQPNFTNLETGQANLANLAQTGLANQAVLQGDIGNVAGAIGTPTTTGQTVFGSFADLGSQVGDLGTDMQTGFGDLSGDLSSFRDLYTNRSGQQMQTLGDLTDTSQRLEKRGTSIERQVQDIQPMVYSTNQAVQSGSFVNPQAMPANSSQALTDTSTALANMGSVTQGPLGPSFIDPRDYV